MAYDFSVLKEKGGEIKEWLDREYAGIRTGRVSPAVLDGVTVEAYGMKMPLNQVATVTVEDPKTLAVTPFDASIIKNIEKGIRENDMGFSAQVGEASIRVSFPDLTAERRESLIKIVNQKEEQAKVSLRTEREKVWDDIQDKYKEGDITEDEKFKFKEEMQKMIDSFTKEIEEKSERKEKELKEN